MTRSLSCCSRFYHNFFRVDGTLDCGSRKLPRLGARSVMSLPCHYVGDTIELKLHGGGGPG
jgi:hypothetical protein